MRLIAGVFLILVSSQTPPVGGQGTWPPPGVLREADGVTRPELLRTVNPRYTPEAMRAGIQGFVTLEFVVETDGSVGPVRVVRSIDRASGLDDAAVAALKQWLFRPGMKGEAPVRVLSRAMLTFRLSNTPPPMSLPAGFDSAPSTSARWVHEGVELEGVSVQFDYPEGWLRPDSPSTAIMMINPNSLDSVGVSRPALMPSPVPFPMPLPELAKFSDFMRSLPGSGAPRMEVIAVGQSSFGTANWLWIEMEASAGNLATLPPEVSAMLKDTLAGVRVWAFATGVGSRLVQVVCVSPQVKSATAADSEAQLSRARTNCSGILRRMSFAAR